MPGKRDVITTTYDDPKRIAAILDEWAATISLMGYEYGWWWDAN
jgi:hypothetical protein